MTSWPPRRRDGMPLTRGRSEARSLIHVWWSASGVSDSVVKLALNVLELRNHGLQLRPAGPIGLTLRLSGLDCFDDLFGCVLGNGPLIRFASFARDHIPGIHGEDRDAREGEADRGEPRLPQACARITQTQQRVRQRGGCCDRERFGGLPTQSNDRARCLRRRARRRGWPGVHVNHSQSLAALLASGGCRVASVRHRAAR